MGPTGPPHAHAPGLLPALWNPPLRTDTPTPAPASSQAVVVDSAAPQPKRATPQRLIEPERQTLVSAPGSARASSQSTSATVSLAMPVTGCTASNSSGS